jgi:hypothetical protein
VAAVSNEVMRFGATASLRQVAAVVGVSVELVIAMCDTHSLPGLTADSVVPQSTAERIARFLEGRPQ